MKRLIILLFSIFLMLSCSIIGGDKNKARKLAQEEFEKHFLSNGDIVTTYMAMDPYNVNYMYYQYKDIDFELREKELNEADKLNNIQYKADVRITSKIMREAGKWSGKFDNKINSDWGSYPEGTQAAFMNIEKRNGNWQINMDRTYLKPKLEDLPEEFRN